MTIWITHSMRTAGKSWVLEHMRTIVEIARRMFEIHLLMEGKRAPFTGEWDHLAAETKQGYIRDATKVYKEWHDGHQPSHNVVPTRKGDC